MLCIMSGVSFPNEDFNLTHSRKLRTLGHQEAELVDKQLETVSIEDKDLKTKSQNLPITSYEITKSRRKSNSKETSKEKYLRSKNRTPMKLVTLGNDSAEIYDLTYESSISQSREISSDKIDGQKNDYKLIDFYHRPKNQKSMDSHLSGGGTNDKAYQNSSSDLNDVI